MIHQTNVQIMPTRQVLSGLSLNTLGNHVKSCASPVIAGSIGPIAKPSPAAALSAAQHQQQQDEQQTTTSSQRYKTELCRSYQENGVCKYGDKCQFAHGSHELRSMQRHPKYKTELCRTFHAAGYCPYGPRCHFVHDTAQNELSVKLASLSSSSSGSSSLSSSSSTSPLSLSRLHLDEIDSLFESSSASNRGGPAADDLAAAFGRSSLLMVSTNPVGGRKDSSSSSSSSSSSGFCSPPQSSRSISPTDHVIIDDYEFANFNNDDLHFKSTDLIVNQILSNIYLDEPQQTANSVVNYNFGI